MPTCIARALVVSALCSCSIPTDFVGESIVAEDGTLTRNTRYIACGACREDLLSDYELPAGGNWDMRRITTRADDRSEDLREVSVYEHSLVYPPGSAIASDFARKSKSSALARNRIVVARRDYFLVTAFRYDEEFRDIITEDGFRSAMMTVYDVWLNHAVEMILEHASEPADATLVRRTIKSISDPVHESWIVRMFAEGAGFMESDEVEDIFHTDEFPSQLAAALSLHGLSLGQDEEDWNDRVAEITGFDPFNSFEESEWGAIEESLLGAHGFELFATYKFSVSVRLPGTVYDTNSDEKNADELRWAFESTEFLLRPYAISARSYLLHPLRIGATGVLLVLIAAAVIVMRSRNWQPVQPPETRT